MAERPAAPGWHPDPWFTGQHRWWDGSAWTADVFPHGPVGPAGAVRRRPPGEQPDGPPPTAYAAARPPAPEWKSWVPEAPASGFLAMPPAEPIASEPRRSLSPRVVNLAALVVGLVLGFVVVGALTRHHDRSPAAASAPTPAAPAPSAPTPSPSAPAPSPSASPSAAPVDPLLQGLVVRERDVPSDHDVQLTPDGTDPRTTATLDLCNGTFASEALRTSRLQVVDVAPDGSNVVSTEAVLYQSAAATAQAFRELGSVAAACPDGPVVSPVGEPTVTTRLRPDVDSAWPTTAGVQRQAYEVTTADVLGLGNHSIVVYLRRGRVLEGLYFPVSAVDALQVDGRTTVAGVVADFEHRIAALPPAAVR